MKSNINVVPAKSKTVTSLFKIDRKDMVVSSVSELSGIGV